MSPWRASGKVIGPASSLMTPNKYGLFVALSGVPSGDEAVAAGAAVDPAPDVVAVELADVELPQPAARTARAAPPTSTDLLKCFTSSPLCRLGLVSLPKSLFLLSIIMTTRRNLVKLFSENVVAP